MPKQEIFFEQQSGPAKVEVVKSYDPSYAREAFRTMDDDAMKRLWQNLDVQNKSDVAELPPLGQPNGKGEDFLWDELLDSAREYGTEVSFFTVNEIHGARTESLWVSPDWPSAESFAKDRLVLLSGGGEPVVR